jgi:hypothetical protein
VDLDSYYTLFSLKMVPGDWPRLPAEGLLQRLGELSFLSEIGKGRVHNVGVRAPDELTIRPFNAETMCVMTVQARQRIALAAIGNYFYPPYGDSICTKCFLRSSTLSLLWKCAWPICCGAE